MRNLTNTNFCLLECLTGTLHIYERCNNKYNSELTREDKQPENTYSMPINCFAIWSSLLVGSHVLEIFMEISSREHDVLFSRLTCRLATANEIKSTFTNIQSSFVNKKVEGIIIASHYVVWHQLFNFSNRKK